MATKNSYLFVGGVKDGTRQYVESDRVDFPVLEDAPLTYMPRDVDVMRMIPFRTERYLAMPIRGFHNEYVVYAEESLDPDDVLAMLIANYSPKKKGVE